MENLKNKLLEKLQKDNKELEHKYLSMEKIDIINKSYTIATQQEFYSVLTWWLEDCCDNDNDITDREYDKLLSINTNLLEYLQERWFDFLHPEYYNFFIEYDSVLDVVDNIIAKMEND